MEVFLNKRAFGKLYLPLALLAMLGSCHSPGPHSSTMERIQVSPDKSGFVRVPSGKPFIPWGFNYDHDAAGRLLEDYWEKEWSVVEEDFREMQALGANVVRIHLQIGKFMDAPDTPNSHALARLNALLQLAERTGLYLDLTGLGCYHKVDVPQWYVALSEADRWSVQAQFWEAVARLCQQSPSVFCFDLMNEPVVPGGDQPRDDWLGPPFGGKHFVQFIALDRAGRQRPDVARAWMEQLRQAIRRQDPKRLITVGLVDWSLDRPGLSSGFVPARIEEHLDFMSVHLYPETGKVQEAIQTLRSFDVGKPILIEETFPLRCGADDFKQFLRFSQTAADGWIGFYWGQTAAELRRTNSIPAAITLQWLELFQTERPLR